MASAQSNGPQASEAENKEQRPENGYWSEGEPRWFISQRTELGIPYLKPYVSAGYGLPHWIWAGVDVNAIITMEVLEVFSGLRLASPVFDVSLGIRDNWSFNKPFLKRLDSYTRDDVFNSPGPNARYWAAELDALAILPLPYSAIGVNFVMVHAFDMPANSALYEESYRLITHDPTFYVLRFVALARVLNEGSLRFGVLAEHGFATGRLSTVWRVGPVISAQITDHLQFNAGVTLKVDSPDALGLSLGAFGTAGFRYYWATGERRPELPWRGKLIPFGGI
ncbi:MAG TPA: hypothetical protein VFN67_28375 [Polyangiales bacterium]|nr:hypothetical protein [Polyangiales bacterium]